MKFRLLVLLFTFHSSSACASDFVRIEVYVHEESGKPVEGADVNGLFFTDQVVNRENLPSHRAITDQEGHAEISGRDPLNVEVYAKKSGYYVSSSKLNVRETDTTKVDILLRPKVNPIAMFARSAVINANPDQGRESGSQFGFDFKVGDFVQPLGKGTTTDILIRHSYEKKDARNYSYQIEVEFPNKKDGLIPFHLDNKYRASRYKSEYMSPATGYVSRLSLSKTRKGSEIKGNFDKSRNYYFRVRTITNENGDIESAHYGKIYGEFPSIAYYFNPTPNDRNLEFDPQKNLFTNLKPSEQVSRP